jgi:hypothetical protein
VRPFTPSVIKSGLLVSRDTETEGRLSVLHDLNNDLILQLEVVLKSVNVADLP